MIHHADIPENPEIGKTSRELMPPSRQVCVPSNHTRSHARPQAPPHVQICTRIYTHTYTCAHLPHTDDLHLYTHVHTRTRSHKPRTPTHIFTLRCAIIAVSIYMRAHVHTMHTLTHSHIPQTPHILTHMCKLTCYPHTPMCISILTHALIHICTRMHTQPGPGNPTLMHTHHTQASTHMCTHFTHVHIHPHTNTHIHAQRHHMLVRTHTRTHTALLPMIGMVPEPVAHPEALARTGGQPGQS